MGNNDNANRRIQINTGNFSPNISGSNEANFCSTIKILNEKLAQYFDVSLKSSSKTLLNLGLFHEYRKINMLEGMQSDSVFLGLPFLFSGNYNMVQDVTSKPPQFGLNISVSFKLKNTILKSISGISRLYQSLLQRKRLG